MDFKEFSGLTLKIKVSADPFHMPNWIFWTMLGLSNLYLIWSLWLTYLPIMSDNIGKMAACCDFCNIIVSPCKRCCEKSNKFS
jgi:hypothetical protein